MKQLPARVALWAKLRERTSAHWVRPVRTSFHHHHLLLLLLPVFLRRQTLRRLVSSRLVSSRPVFVLSLSLSLLSLFASPRVVTLFPPPAPTCSRSLSIWSY